MARHARNNTASAVFTHYEKSKLNYGTQKQRLGKDSLRDIDSCCLCLKPVVNPLSCLKGHIFCKECIYENLLAQKLEIKRTTKIWQLQQDQLAKEKELDTKKKLEEEENHAMRYIISPVATLEGRAPIRTSVSQTTTVTESLRPTSTPPPSTSLVPVKELTPLEKRTRDLLVIPEGTTFMTPDGRIHPIEKEYNDPVIKKAQFEALEKLKFEKDEAKNLTSFWVASQTPEARSKPMEKPLQTPQCTERPLHSINLKDLITVHFTPVPNIDDEDPNRLKNGRYQCPVCLKTFTNSTKATLLKGCGHVICTSCLAAFVHDEKKCYVCNEVCDTKDFIQVQAGGTGFAGHGEDLEATKYRPSAWV